MNGTITYGISHIAVNGTEDNPQIFYFTQFTDVMDNALPTFDSAPTVGLSGKYQDRGARIIVGSITETSFQVSLNSFGQESTNYYFDLNITG